MWSAKAVEEHLVAVAQAGEVVVLGERGAGRVVLLVDAAHLVADRGDLAGHEADETEVAPFLDGEGRPAVGHGVGQHGPPTSRDAQGRVPAGRVELVLVVDHLLASEPVPGDIGQGAGSDAAVR